MQCGLNMSFLHYSLLTWNLRYSGPETMYDYDLFAVINHEGKMNNGHYTNFARFQDEVCLYNTLVYNH